MEYKHALAKAGEIIHSQAGDRLNRGSAENEEHLLGGGGISAGEGAPQDQFGAGLSYIAGAVNQDETERLKRLVFRATRSNALTITENIKNSLYDHSGKKMDKAIYVIIFKEGATIREKLNKICDSFLGERFDIPADGNIVEAIQEVEAKRNET